MIVTLTASQSKIIIAGGTGFLGQLLSQSFLSDGHEVILFSRCHSTEATVGRAVFWDAENLDEWVNELDGANLLINLTGKSIDCRHTKANREEILDYAKEFEWSRIVDEYYVPAMNKIIERY